MVKLLADIEEAVYEVLRLDSAVTALVGMRIFQEQLAQGATMPALSYQLISDPSENSHKGPSGLAEARVQFDIWGDTKQQTYALSLAVRKAFAGRHSTNAGVSLQGAFKDNETTLFDTDIRKRRRVLEMLIWHSEDQ